jgi:ABC-type branched-subunit amino acid transport system ATPase component
MVAQERTSPTPLAASLVGLRGSDKRKEAKADELLELMGLGPFRDYQINALSTGTKRIVEITCLAALEPTILLLDEPSSGIAQRETETLEGVIRALKAYLAASIIVIEHDIPLVSALADRMIAMDAGRVLAVGSPIQVLADPGVITAYLGTDTRTIERSTFSASAAPTTPTATT